ncbi:hypothetical protein BC941DRAFT_468138 [Chlamydoabsidia padenii]|nr:hypothetical protein BC941DRAFT_468138 [Chlamydoabsidia padenii]
MLAIPLKTSQWRKIPLQLNQLASLLRPLPSQGTRVLMSYERLDQPTSPSTKTNKAILDDMGRAYALEDYFKRRADRDQVVLPMTMTANKGVERKKEGQRKARAKYTW